MAVTVEAPLSVMTLLIIGLGVPCINAIRVLIGDRNE